MRVYLPPVWVWAAVSDVGIQQLGKTTVVTWDAQAAGEPVLDFFLGMWRGIRLGDRLPSRADFNLRTIAPFARHIAIVAVEPDGRFRFKLVGDAVQQISTPFQTGKLTSEIYQDTYRSFGEQLETLYRDVIGRRQPVTVDLRSIDWTQGLAMHFRALHLPLSSAGHDVDNIMSVLRYEYAAAQAAE